MIKLLWRNIPTVFPAVTFYWPETKSKLLWTGVFFRRHPAWGPSISADAYTDQRMGVDTTFRNVNGKATSKTPWNGISTPRKCESGIYFKFICTLGLILYYCTFSFCYSALSADVCVTVMESKSSSLLIESAVGSPDVWSFCIGGL